MGPEAFVRRSSILKKSVGEGSSFRLKNYVFMIDSFELARK